MRITLAGYTTPFSGNIGTSLGISKYIYYIGRELVKMGHDVRLFIRDDYRPKEKWITTVHAPKSTWLVYPFYLKPKIMSQNSDVYHADYVNTGAALAWAGKRPRIVTIHDALPFHYPSSDLRPKDRVINAFYKFYFRFIRDADAIVVRSEAAKEEAVKYAGLDESRVHVTFGGVDTNFFKPLKKERHEKIRIGYVGGLDGRKNVRLLVETFKNIVAERDNVELHVGGGGASLEKFRSMKIPNTFFYGFVPENKLNQFINSLDVFVYPTLGEGLGLPPLEAMASGTPVIASDTTSMPEVVGDAGILAKPDVKSMRVAIEGLVDNSSLRRSLSRKGLERAKKYDWKACAKDTLDLYESVQN